jgi:plasmid stabilization system protein ParE
MSGSFQVDFSDPAKSDLDRLFEFLLTRATSVEDLDGAQEVIGELRQAIEAQLARAPFNYRKAGSPLRRELVVPVGKSGYVALYDIRPPSHVLVLALRHQLEDDYH